MFVGKVKGSLWATRKDEKFKWFEIFSGRTAAK